MSLRAQELPYHADSAILFGHIAHLPWAIYLDSGWPGSQYGRYDIMAAEPFVKFSTDGSITRITDSGGVHESQDDPFLLLKQQLARYPVSASRFPFTGGAIGFFGYDLARRLEQFPDHAADSEHIPQMMTGFYDWAVVVDHNEKRAWLVTHGLNPQTQNDWQRLCALFGQPSSQPAGDFRVKSNVHSNMDKVGYTTAFDKIKQYIYEGDCYQVNLAQRFSARAEGDAWLAYQQLRRISPTPYMAYMNLPQLQVLSASPERFLRVKDGRVETRPIKGTRPRHDDPAQDASNRAELEGSLKDSTVTGQLGQDKTAIDLLRGCFPGGSVTGAPKLRAMEIIEELEPNRRGLYCGAIGYIGFDGNMDTNITIRTGVYSAGEFRFWAGGGIVADSELDKEYGETWDKASSMLQLMQHFTKERSDTDVGN